MIKTLIQCMSLRSVSVSWSSVLAGCAIAAMQGCLVMSAMVLCLLFVALVQIITNLCDVYNSMIYNKGVVEDMGIAMITRSGLPTKTFYREAIIGLIILACFLGFPLLSLSSNPWWLLLAALVAGIVWLNTMGPRPLGRTVWGILVTFIVFGPLIVLGTYFVQASYVAEVGLPGVYLNFKVWSPALMLSIVPGLYAVAILLINTYSSYRIDLSNVRETLTTRYGLRFTRIAIIAINIFAAIWSCIIFYLYAPEPYALILYILSIAVCLFNILYIVNRLYKGPRTLHRRYENIEMLIMLIYSLVVFVIFELFGHPDAYSVALFGA